MQDHDISEISKELVVIEGHLIALEFISIIHISQSGIPNIQALLRNIEKASIAPSDIDTERAASLADEANRHLQRMRDRLEESLEIWHQMESSSQTEMARG